MSDEFNKELCDERHKTVERMFNKIDKNIETLFGRLNWFYVVVIGTLMTALSAMAMVILK